METAPPPPTSIHASQFAILAFVLLATWFFFGGKNSTLKERDMLDSAFNGGKAAASAGDLSDSGRDFVAAMQQAVSHFAQYQPQHKNPAGPCILYEGNWGFPLSRLEHATPSGSGSAICRRSRVGRVGKGIRKMLECSRVRWELQDGSRRTARAEGELIPSSRTAGSDGQAQDES